jgi:acyl carrier protein
LQEPSDIKVVSQNKGDPILSARIRIHVKELGQLKTDIDSLPDDADLYAAGLTSQVTVNLMLALEEEFGVEFPDELLKRRTFASVDAISHALTGLGAKAAITL